MHINKVKNIDKYSKKQFKYTTLQILGKKPKQRAI